jgi:hypothetical protein
MCSLIGTSVKLAGLGVPVHIVRKCDIAPRMPVKSGPEMWMSAFFRKCGRAQLHSPGSRLDAPRIIPIGKPMTGVMCRS